MINGEKAHQMLDLVLKINDTKASAFFDYCGHVDEIFIAIHNNGWVSGHDADYMLDIDDELEGLNNGKFGELKHGNFSSEQAVDWLENYLMEVTAE